MEAEIIYPFLGAIVIFGVFYFISNKITKRKDREKSPKGNNNFNPDVMITNNVGVDRENGLIGVRQFKAFKEVWKLSDIKSYELVEDGQTITSGGLGRAVVGGLAFGGVGALVGAVTGGKKDKSKVTKFQIKFNTTDISNPVRYIDLIKVPTKRNTLIYEQAVNDADKILSSLNILLDN